MIISRVFVSYALGMCMYGNLSAGILSACASQYTPKMSKCEMKVYLGMCMNVML